MGWFHVALDLIGIEHENPHESVFTWGNGWWAQERDGKVNLTLFALPPKDAALIVAKLGDGERK